MLLLSAITTVEMANAKIADLFCVFLHLLGGFMFFVGYILAEGHAIGWACFSRGLPLFQRHDREESLRIRKFMLTMVAIFYTIFIILQVVLVLKPSMLVPVSDDDKWETSPYHKAKVLVDTAHTGVQLLKIFSYASEVICGLFLIASHMVIWYFCEERHYDLPEELETLAQKFGPKEVNSDFGSEVDSDFASEVDSEK